MPDLFAKSGLFGNHLRDHEISAALSGDAMLAKMVAFERAWTIALGKQGVIDQEKVSGVVAALENFQADLGALSAGSDRDGLPVPTLVKQLRAHVGGDLSDAVHTHATSQDVIDTALVLCLMDALSIVAPRLVSVIDRLDKLAVHHGKNTLRGRTRMQAALPISVAQRVATWRAPLARCDDLLGRLRLEIGRVQCGGAVGDRAGLNGKGDAIAAEIATILGLTNAPVWHTDRQAIVDVGHWLMLLTGALGKIGQDITLMAQQGIDAVKLVGAGSSSAMPHKQNPVRAEILITHARYVAAQQALLGGVLVHEQERSGAMWTLEWMTLPAMVEIAGAALNVAVGLLDQISGLGDK